MQSNPGFRAFRQRLLIAIGALPALAACGGKVVFVDDDGAGGSTSDGGGGAPTIPTNGGAGGDVTAGGAPGLCPGHEGAPYVCMQTFEGCPPAASEEAFQLVKAKIEQDQSCTNDPQFCWCSALISDIPCGPDPSALECCYVVEYGIQEQCEGRPFIVDDVLRVAPLVARADWSVTLAPLSTQLSAASRTAIARVWQRRAQFEHASVASFARFTLELLSVGAPADLVAAATQAAGDEVEHARACFGVASAFAGEPIGPGPLPVAGALDGRRSLAEIASAAVVEGCIGETCAALEAAATHAATGCPVLSPLMEKIAADEQIHAELAWRFVAWASRTGGDDVRAAIACAFQAAPSFEVESCDLDAVIARHFGVRTAAEQRLTRERAWREVIAPARAELLREAGSRPSRSRLGVEAAAVGAAT
jgi:hypothetical protein